MRLWIDTDAGVDDAQAIVLALRHAGVTVEGITTVSGNVDVAKVNRNVATILDVLDADVPVYPGAARPLVSPHAPTDSWIHGRDGLGDWPDRPPTTRAVRAERAATALIAAANAFPGALTLVALGPLTNLALAARLDPSFPAAVGQLIFMGGTIAACGNADCVTAEFNVYADPEAAHIVLDAFPRARMVSWETTLAHPLPWSVYDELAAMPGSTARFFAGTSRALATVLRAQTAGFLLPDPLAMAVALRPSLIGECEERYVTVELNGTLTRGQTVIDHAGRLGKAANVEIVKAVDMRGVADLFREALA